MLNLDAVAWASGIPGPVGELHIGGDFTGLRPSDAIVHGTGHKHPARILADPGFDVLFTVFSEIPRHQQPDRACVAVNDRCGIAAGVGGIGPDNLLFVPRPAIINRAADAQIYLAGIATGILPSLGKGQHGALGGDGERGDAVGVIPGLATAKQWLAQSLNR